MDGVDAAIDLNGQNGESDVAEDTNVLPKKQTDLDMKGVDSVSIDCRSGAPLA